MGNNVNMDNLKNTVAVELSLEEVILLQSALGNHNRAEMREHVANDFTQEAADEIIVKDSALGMMLMMTGQEVTHNLFGKLDGTFHELNG